jgi:hypothetical protein
MTNVLKKQIEVFIPPYRKAMVENLLRVVRITSSASTDSDSSLMDVEVKEMVSENEEGTDEELPDITDALIDTTTGVDSTRVEKLLDEIILRAHAQGKTRQIDLKLEETEIEELVSEIGTLEVKAQYKRVEMIDPLKNMAEQPPQVVAKKAGENSRQEKTATDVLVFSPRHVEPKIRKRRISKTERRGLSIGLKVF